MLSIPQWRTTFITFNVPLRVITTKLTGKIKRREERTQLYFVRVQRLVMCCFYMVNQIVFHLKPQCAFS